MRRRLLALAAAVAVASLPGSWAGAGDDPLVVEVTMRFSRFEPSEIVVPAGAEVRFVVRNLDPIDHEFILGDQEVQDRHERGTDPHHGAIPGEVSVAAGETAETVYRFGEPGTLLIGCHLPGHWDYGMRAVVRVV